MIWTFERGERALRIVTRFDKDQLEYVVDIEWSDGLTETERFTDRSLFQSRILTLEQQLQTERWQQSGGPKLIDADWWEP